MRVFIYSLSHPETNEVRYIGLTRNTQRRFKQYLLKGHTRHLDNWLKSIASLGMQPTMTILEECDETNACDAERKWIEVFKAANANLLNYTNGGESSFTISDETKEKIRATWTEERRKKQAEITRRMWTPERKAAFTAVMKGRPRKPGTSHFIKLNKARAGIPLSEQARLKLSIAQRGKKKVLTEDGRRRQSERSKALWQNPEIVEKIKAGQRRGAATTHAIFKLKGDPRKGRKLSEEHRRKVSEGVRRSQTPEYCRKMSEIKKGIQWTPMTPETRAKISASLKGRKLTPTQVEQRRQAIKLRKRNPLTGKLA